MRHNATKTPSGLICLGLAALAMTAVPGLAQERQAIGISAPISGPFAVLGAQAEAGARVAAASLGFDLAVEDDSCTADGGARAARALVERKVVAVVGYLCGESLDAAMPTLKDANIAAITISVRANALTDQRKKTGWPVFRMAPRADGEAAAVASIVPGLWPDTPFAILDDGAISNRDLAETLRLAAEDAGHKPVLVDSFRPGLDRQEALIKRLRGGGAKAVFIAGDAADVGVIARDAGDSLAVAAGETLASKAGPLPQGVMMIGLPAARDLASAATLAALEKAGVLPDGYVLPAYAAVEVVASASKSDGPLAARISAETTQTGLGPIRFDAKGDLAVSPYQLFTFDGARFVRVEGQ